MARTFDATSEKLEVTSPSVLPAASGTISLWIKPAWNSGDSASRWFLDASGSSANDRLVFLRFSDNNIYVGWLRVSPLNDDRIIVSDSGLFSSGTWAHWAFRWNDSANTCELFRNGSSVASRTSDLVTYSLTTNLVLGNVQGFGGAEDSRGDLQEFGMWSSSLSNDDISALAKGFSPAMVSPSTLECYLPLVGRQSPERDIVGGQSFTVTGATVADHKGMFYPQAPFYPPVSAVVPPSPVYSPSNIIWF